MVLFQYLEHFGISTGRERSAAKFHNPSSFQLNLIDLTCPRNVQCLHGRFHLQNQNICVIDWHIHYYPIENTFFLFKLSTFELFKQNTFFSRFFFFFNYHDFLEWLMMLIFQGTTKIMDETIIFGEFFPHVLRA